MDRHLQEKLDEYGAGFSNFLQEKFLADEYARKGKAMAGEITTELTDLCHKADDNRSELICVTNYAYSDDYFNNVVLEEIAKGKMKLNKPCDANSASSSKKGV